MSNVTPAGGRSEAAGGANHQVEGGRAPSQRGMPTPASVPREFGALVGKAEGESRPSIRSPSGSAPRRLLPAHSGRAKLLPPAAAEDICRLDAQAFGAHQSVSMQDLALIAEHGFFVGIRDDREQLVAYASVIDRPCSYYDIEYVSRLAPQQWYLEAMAAAPAAKGSGLGEQVLGTVMRMAERNDVKEVRASLRPENHASMHRLVNNHGFEIIGYHEHYFPESDGDRLVARRDLTKNKRYQIDEATMVTANLDAQLGDKAVHTIGIPIGDDADTPTRRLLRKALAEGFVGVAFLRRPADAGPSVLALVHPLRINGGQAPAAQRSTA